MVLVESMAAGTPAISYDIKYGPNDIIVDGKNGFIVPNGNKKQLAQKIIKIMKEDKVYESMSKNALDVRETFSEQEYQKNWLNLIEVKL